MKRELTLEDIKFQHLLKKLPTAGKHTPVTGYYHIVKQLPSNYSGDAARNNKYLFEAYYHPFKPDFSLTFKVPVMIWAFYNNCSVGPKECELKELIGAVINLSEFAPYNNEFVDQSTGEITEWTSYKAVWEVIAYVDATIAQDLSALSPDVEIEEPDELLAADAEFEEELEAMLFDADIEMIDEETELIFWEANQPNWCMSHAEVEVMLDQMEIESLQANMNK